MVTEVTVCYLCNGMYPLPMIGGEDGSNGSYEGTVSLQVKGLVKQSL